MSGGAARRAPIELIEVKHRINWCYCMWPGRWKRWLERIWSERLIAK